MSLDLLKAALLIIDLQADVFRGGALTFVGTDEILSKAKQTLAAARLAGLIDFLNALQSHQRDSISILFSKQTLSRGKL